MRKLTITCLILSLLASTAAYASGAPGAEPETIPLTADEMQSISGTGFLGGTICGAAIAGAAIGTFAVVTAAGMGSTLALGAVFAYSVSLHVGAICIML